MAPLPVGAESSRDAVPVLSCQKTLELGLAGYEKYYEHRLGGLSRPDQDHVWSSYAKCRQQRNQQLIARLAPPKRQQILELQRALKALEESYLACAYTESYSASIGGLLKSWSIPVREDLYARLLPHLRRDPGRPVQMTPPLREVLARAERQAGNWERIASAVKKDADAYHLARARDLRKQLPILRRELRKLALAGQQLPAPLQGRLARHLAVYLNHLDHWERG